MKKIIKILKRIGFAVLGLVAIIVIALIIDISNDTPDIPKSKTELHNEAFNKLYADASGATTTTEIDRLLTIADTLRLDVDTIGLNAKIDMLIADRQHMYQSIANRNKISQERARQAGIDAQFSAWDGSHKNLTALIKESMHDPKSYDHNKTAYADKGDYLLVEQSYRGKNAFGGVVLNTVLVKVDMNGAVIEVLNE